MAVLFLSPKASSEKKKYQLYLHDSKLYKHILYSYFSALCSHAYNTDRVILGHNVMFWFGFGVLR